MNSRKLLISTTLLIIAFIIEITLLFNDLHENIPSYPEETSITTIEVITSTEVTTLADTIVESSSPEVEETTEIILEYIPPKDDIDAIARTLYGECRGIDSDMHKAAVAWVILNRIDAGYGDSVIEVVSARKQFVGYNPNHPVEEELASLAEDVLKRWYSEKDGNQNAGRVLPPDYLWFTGDGDYNYFRNEFHSDEFWDWSLGTPYDN